MEHPLWMLLGRQLAKNSGVMPSLVPKRRAKRRICSTNLRSRDEIGKQIFELKRVFNRGLFPLNSPKMLVWKPGLLYHLIQLDVLKDSPRPLPNYFKIDLMESSNSKSFDWIVPSIEPCKYLKLKLDLQKTWPALTCCATQPCWVLT